MFLQYCAKVGTHFFFVISKIRKFLALFRNHKSANFWGAPVLQIANPQICSDEPVNRKSANFLGVPVPKSQIRKIIKGNSCVPDPDPDWFASAIIIYPRKYIADFEILCNAVSKLSQKKPKVFSKFMKAVKAHICKKKNYAFANMRKF